MKDKKVKHKYKLLSPNDIVHGKNHFSKENGKFVLYEGLCGFVYKNFVGGIKIYKKVKQ